MRFDVRIPPKIQKDIERKGGLESIIQKLPAEEELRKMANLYHALSDVNRLKILHFLRFQESCVCLLREITGLSYSKLSYHLKIMKDVNLIKFRKYKNYAIYSLTEFGERIVSEKIWKGNPNG